MRCPSCNKFVSFEEQEPEINSIEVDGSGNVAIDCRIVNTCAECGDELKEATFQLEEDCSEDCKEHEGEGHELNIEDSGAERTSRSGHYDRKKGQWINHGGRYAQTMYGVEVGYSITCSCGNLLVEGTVSDDVQASSMDELV